MAGFKSTEPRNKQGEWTSGGGSGAQRASTGRFTQKGPGIVNSTKKLLRNVGLMETPRKHKAKSGKIPHETDQLLRKQAAVTEAHLRNSQAAADQDLRNFVRGAATETVLGGVSGLANLGLRKLGSAAGVDIHTTRRRSGGAGASLGHPASYLNESGLGMGGQVQKIPNSISTGDATFFHLNVKIGKEKKKKRPTFPHGYHKRDPYEGI